MTAISGAPIIPSLRPVTTSDRAGSRYNRSVARSKLAGFDEFFSDEYDAIVRSAYLVLGDETVAAEVAQDAFTEAVVHWRKIKRYDKPGAWVRRVAIRKAIRVRQRDGKRSRLMIEATQTAPQPGQTGLSLELQAALETLSPRQRAVVVLHYFEGLPVGEAADVVGCSAATASVHLHRARNQIASQLTATSERSDVPHHA